MVQVAGGVATPAAASLAVRSGVSFGASSRNAVMVGARRGAAATTGVRASTSNSNDVSTKVVTGVVFEPFSEVHDQLAKVSTSPQLESLARQRFSPSCEAAINDQIKYELFSVLCILLRLFSSLMF